VSLDFQVCLATRAIPAPPVLKAYRASLDSRACLAIPVTPALRVPKVLLALQAFRVFLESLLKRVSNPARRP
jgi:hypothetical protein